MHVGGRKVWRRFDTRKGHSVKRRLVRKLLSSYIITLILLTSFSIIFVSTGLARLSNPSDVILDVSGDDPPEGDLSSDVSPGGDLRILPPSGDDPPEVDPPVVGDVSLELPNDDGYSVTAPVFVGGENDGYVTGHLDGDIPDSQVEGADTNFGSGYSLSTIYITPENQEETGVFSIEFTPATYLTDVDETVVKLDGKSLGIPVISEEGIAVFGYLDINLVANGTSIEENAINSLYFKFKINKTWIQENNIDNETITLMRYHNGSWQELNTTINDENDTYFYFEAAAPGCGSTFAIIGTEVVEVQPYPTQPQGIPWTVIAGFIIAASIVLVITLFKAEYIYAEDKHNTDESEKKSNRKTNKRSYKKPRLQLFNVRSKGTTSSIQIFQRRFRCLLSALQVHVAKYTFLINSSVSIMTIVAFIS